MEGIFQINQLIYKHYSNNNSHNTIIHCVFVWNNGIMMRCHVDHKHHYMVPCWPETSLFGSMLTRNIIIWCHVDHKNHYLVPCWPETSLFGAMSTTTVWYCAMLIANMMWWNVDSIRQRYVIFHYFMKIIVSTVNMHLFMHLTWLLFNIVTISVITSIWFKIIHDL